MTHLGFYRTFGFGAKACQPHTLKSSYGASVEYSDQYMPLQMKEDIHAGHVKMVVLKRAMSEDDAVELIEKAKKQMAEFQ